MGSSWILSEKHNELFSFYSHTGIIYLFSSLLLAPADSSRREEWAGVKVVWERTLEVRGRFPLPYMRGIYGDNRCYLETKTYFREKLKHNKPQGFCFKQINIQIPKTTEMWQDIRHINKFRGKI